MFLHNNNRKNNFEIFIAHIYQVHLICVIFRSGLGMGKTNRKVSRRNRSARLPCLEDSAKVCLQQGAGHRRGEGHEQTGRSLPLQGLPPEATDQDRYTATKIIRTFVLYG